MASATIDLRGARIAVTGATGFLGRYVVDALRSRGAHVVGVVRNPDRVPELAAQAVELRRADLAEPDALARGFADAQAVVSNAALFSLRNQRWDDHVRCNVEGTRNVFEACARAGVRRVVHVSSVAVYGFGHRGVLDETQPMLEEARTWRLPWNVYPLSKALSERAAWALAEHHGIALTTVRPCTIYGAHDPNFMPVFARVVGLPITMMPAWLTMCFVHAGDVAEAIVRALERPASASKAYNVTGPPETAWDFARAWRAAGGRVARVMLPLPVPLTLSFDASRARHDLDFAPRSLVDGLREALARWSPT